MICRDKFYNILQYQRWIDLRICRENNEILFAECGKQITFEEISNYPHNIKHLLLWKQDNII